jgi:hypothetical protein
VIEWFAKIAGIKLVEITYRGPQLRPRFLHAGPDLTRRARR